MQIVVMVDGQRKGPFDLKGLRQAILEGKISVSSLAWYPGCAEWSRILDMPELAAAVLPRMPLEQPRSRKEPNAIVQHAPEVIVLQDTGFMNQPRRIASRPRRLGTRVIVAIVAFFSIYCVISFFQTERALYAKLNGMWSASSGSIEYLSVASKQISQASSDQDLQFTADYLSTMAGAYYDGGVRDLSEIKRGSSWDLASTGFINGCVNPIGALKNIAKTVWLMWNKSEFETKVFAVDNRYGGLNGTAIVCGLVGAFVCFKFFPSKRSSAP